MKEQGHMEMLTAKGGVSRRVTKLGRKRYINEELNKHVCSSCDLFFPDKPALRMLKQTGYCFGVPAEEKSYEEQRKRAATMEREAAKRMYGPTFVETLSLKTIEKKPLKCAGSFKYLGTTTTTENGIRAELK